MRSAKSVGLLAALLLIAASAMSLVAWGEITLWSDGGEVQWVYRGDEDLGDQICQYVEDRDPYCRTPYGTNDWGVEIAADNGGDWAQVALDCAGRFTFGDILQANLAFSYHMIDNPLYGIGANSGPHLAFWLSDNGTNYLLISAGADATQSGSCVAFSDVADGTWWWGRVDTATGTYLGEPREYVKLDTLIDPYTPQSGLLAALPAAYSNYDVMAVLVVMEEGIIDTADGLGQAIVDDVVLNWDGGAFGGTYYLEYPWEATVDFDDWTSTPPSNPSVPPLEWSRWCTDDEYCPHCLPEDSQNLWTIVKESDFPASIPSAAKTFPSGDYAIYFGVKSEGNYDLGEAAVGTVCSPINHLNPGDKYVSVTFDYFRQVESYMGDYDWTFVQVWFDDWSGLAVDPFSWESPADVEDCGPDGGKSWKTIWYKDSSDPCTGQWEEAVITHYVDEDGEPYDDSDNDPDEDNDATDDHRIRIPPNATRMQIRFGFNSRDGASNNYLGWVIDNVVKEHSPEPSGCRIITDHLPQGEVGDKYPAGPDAVPYIGFELDPQVVEGSTTGPRAWSIVSVTKDGERTSLPRRLALDPRGRLYGELDPGTTGTYEITFHLECWDGRPQEKTLTLSVRAATAGLEEGVLFHQQTFDNPYDTWTINTAEVGCGDATTTVGLWHQTSEVRYALDTQAVMDEYVSVGYFGKDDTSDDRDPNYACNRSKGCITSPKIPVGEDQDGEELIIGFKSWRNVEYFTGGEYDRTWVEVREEGGNWVTVWAKSSKDPSLAEWTWEEVHTGLLLKDGQGLYVRFCFDSIDGYKNMKEGEAYGWLVDEISLYAGGAELAIASCPREDTSVGEYYREEVRVSGGAAITPEWDIASGELPPGIGLNPDPDDPTGRQAFLEGVARTEGRYEFTIRVSDLGDSGAVATRDCVIVVTSNVTLLFEDFENDPAWGGTGLWHYTGDDGVADVDDLDDANHAAYYGKGDTTDPSYNTGGRTDGMLTLVTPVISLAGVDAVKVQFDSWREVENFGNGGYDKTYVQVKLGGGDWKTIWTRDSSVASADEWTSEGGIPTFLTGGASTMLIRFVFDSVDKWYNNFTGWLVDNIKIQSAPAGGANPLSLMRIDETRAVGRDTPAELQVMNVPNPVTDVHTTTFMVRSVDVEAMKIAIYDLAGNKVYEEEVQGNELVWHTDNDYGEFLANGIYLYRAYVLVDGVWVETTVQKLVILR